MRTKYIIMAVFILLVYCVGSYYISSRIILSLLPFFSPASFILYKVIFSFLSSAYVLGRVGNVFFPSYGSDWLVKVGAYWLGIIFYLWLLWIVLDAVVWMGRMIGLLDSNMTTTTPGVALILVAITGIIVLYGTWRARSPQITAYTIAINKRCSMDALDIVMVSDLHLGLLVGRKRLEKLVATINELKPDLVLLPGDILDENVGVFVDDNMGEVLRCLRPPLGVYGCLGSHEYIWGSADKAIQVLTQAGVTILRDERILIADSFYVIGRDDRYKKRLTNQPRQYLHDIMSGCDSSRPFILMDHQPVDLAVGQLQEIDLSLSGHTHHGQVVPINWLTGILFKNDWGYGRMGNFQFIVSSGFGTWGPPIRVGTIPEVVTIRITFEK